MFKEEKRMVKVTDDWYPCFNENEIELKMFIYYNELNGCDEFGEPYEDYTGMVKVIASGGDDFAMELAYTLPSKFYDNLIMVYETWKKHVYDKVPNNIDKQWFYEHGFLVS